MADISKVVPFVARETSQETIDVLRYWLRQAELGNITGCVIAVSMTGFDYGSAFTGKCRLHPVFSRGLVLSLYDEVRALADPNHL